MFTFPVLHIGDKVEFANTAGVPQSHWELGEVTKVKIDSVDLFVQNRRMVFMDVRHIDDPSIHDPKRQVRADSGVFKLTHGELLVRKVVADMDLLRREVNALREVFQTVTSSEESTGRSVRNHVRNGN
jgi:hypothetical protein